MFADHQQKAQARGMLSRGGPALAVIGIHVILIYVISASMGIVPLPTIKPGTDVVFLTEEQPIDQPEPIVDPDIKPIDPLIIDQPPPPLPALQIDDIPAPPADNAPSLPVQTAPVDPAANAGQPQQLRTRQRFDPIYPASSRRDGEEGSVRLRVLVDERGRPSQVEVDKSSGFTRLDEAAMEAVRRWRFQAATNGSAAISAWTQVAISFKLTDKERR